MYKVSCRFATNKIRIHLRERDPGPLSLYFQPDIKLTKTDDRMPQNIFNSIRVKYINNVS